MGEKALRSECDTPDMVREWVRDQNPIGTDDEDGCQSSGQPGDWILKPRMQKAGRQEWMSHPDPQPRRSKPECTCSGETGPDRAALYKAARSP